jgi:hypothetical protein
MMGYKAIPSVIYISLIIPIPKVGQVITNSRMEERRRFKVVQEAD